MRKIVNKLEFGNFKVKTSNELQRGDIFVSPKYSEICLVIFEHMTKAGRLRVRHDVNGLKFPFIPHGHDKKYLWEREKQQHLVIGNIEQYERDI